MKVTPELLSALGFEKYSEDTYKLRVDLGKSYDSTFTYYMSDRSDLDKLLLEIINFVKQGTEDVIKEKLIGKLLQ